MYSNFNSNNDNGVDIDALCSMFSTMSLDIKEEAIDDLCDCEFDASTVETDEIDSLCEYFVTLTANDNVMEIEEPMDIEEEFYGMEIEEPMDIEEEFDGMAIEEPMDIEEDFDGMAIEEPMNIDHLNSDIYYYSQRKRSSTVFMDGPQQVINESGHNKRPKC